MKKKFLLLPVIFSLCLVLLPAQETENPSPFEPELVKAFADSLYQEGFLLQAEGEYKRYLFSQPENPDKINFNSSLISLCNIYRQQKNIEGALWLNEKFYNQAEVTARQKMSFLKADFLFRERNAAPFSLFAADIEKDLKTFMPDFSRLTDVSQRLLNKDISVLKIILPGYAQESALFEPLNELCTSYKTKSPALALFLSMILPGSGRWYTGSFGAFVSSFLTIGTFATGTVLTGIQTKWKSWQPYVFGTCGLVLYITELYGSYQSARRYNDALFRVLCEETEKIYGKLY